MRRNAIRLSLLRGGVGIGLVAFPFAAFFVAPAFAFALLFSARTSAAHFVACRLSVAQTFLTTVTPAAALAFASVKRYAQFTPIVVGDKDAVAENRFVPTVNAIPFDSTYIVVY